MLNVTFGLGTALAETNIFLHPNRGSAKLPGHITAGPSMSRPRAEFGLTQWRIPSHPVTSITRPASFR